MISPKQFYEELESLGVDFFTGVPDSLLKHFCAYITETVSSDKHIIAANEGGAVGLAVGHYLATQRLPIVYMQNSGLGNAVNPLTSLADEAVYKIPMILVIGWRGEPGVSDEPQHKKMGPVTLGLLDVLGISHVILSDSWEVAKEEVQKLYKEAVKTEKPVAIVVRKGTFDGCAPRSNKHKTPYSLSREDALEKVVGLLEEKDVVVSTTGKLSRELFELREKRGEGHEKDFLTVGSMGHASQIALSIALSKPKGNVLCLDGDGAALMHLGGLATIAHAAPRNFIHIVFNNGVHDSVGGQPTTGFFVDFCKIAKASGYKTAIRAEDTNTLGQAIKGLVGKDGPHFVEIRIKGGSREDLGRPAKTTEENKKDFQTFLEG